MVDLLDDEPPGVPNLGGVPGAGGPPGCGGNFILGNFILGNGGCGGGGGICALAVNETTVKAATTNNLMIFMLLSLIYTITINTVNSFSNVNKTVAGN